MEIWLPKVEASGRDGMRPPCEMPSNDILTREWALDILLAARKAFVCERELPVS